MAIAEHHIAALTGIAGSRGWTTDQDTIAPHLREWRDKFFGRTQLMVMPDCTATTAKLIEYCNAHRIAVVPQGGNTGLVGGSLPGLGDRDEILFSTKRLNAIHSIDVADRTLIAGAGAVIADIQQTARDNGLLFPLSLASEGSCTVGGTISTNAGGVHVIRYGTMRHLTLGLEAVLPDGSVYSNLSPLRKDNTGYDLTGLLAGAEGTLGVITAACLRLAPQERQQLSMWLAVPDVTTAIQVMNDLQVASADRLSAFEILPASILEMALRHIPGTTDPLPGGAGPWYVLAEIGSSVVDTALQHRLEHTLGQLLDAGRITAGALAQNEAQRQNFWRLRESLSAAQKCEGASIKHDIALPLSRLVEFLAAATPAIEKRWPGVRVVPFGHLGDGNLHYNVMQPIKSGAQSFLAHWQDMNRFVHDLVTEFGGSISAEHGIGSMKASELKRLKPQSEISAYKRIKAALDPNSIMNPGVLFSAE